MDESLLKSTLLMEVQVLLKQLYAIVPPETAILTTKTRLEDASLEDLRFLKSEYRDLIRSLGGLPKS